jgi:DNA-binding NarL/FixJ family response regulator
MYAHYEHEQAVDPKELARAAARSGVEDKLLRALMQAGPWGSRRPPALEPCPLSKSELMAMRGLADGKVYKQIAEDLGRSPSTIRTQLKTSCQKLGVRDRAQAVLLASKHGWL